MGVLGILFVGFGVTIGIFCGLDVGIDVVGIFGDGVPSMDEDDDELLPVFDFLELLLLLDLLLLDVVVLVVVPVLLLLLLPLDLLLELPSLLLDSLFFEEAVSVDFDEP